MSKRVIIDEAGKSATVRLRNVRLSFPNLFKAYAFKEGDKPMFGATFLMLKEGDPENNAEYVQKAIDAVVKMGLKGKKPSPDRLCLRDAGLKDEIDGYDDTQFLLSSNNAKALPVVDRDLTPLRVEDNKPYAGCYVNATVRLWPQDDKQYGKRVNAQLRAVQFFGDGEPFGQSAADPVEEFEDCGDDDDAGIL